VCKALELAAIERICQLCLNTTAHLAPARKACDELGWLLGQGYSVELGESDRRFHHALVALAGNGRSASVHYQASVAASMGDDWNVEDWLRSGQTALEEHRAIVDLLQERELLKAQRLLRDHWAGRMRTRCSSGEVARPVPVMPAVTPLL
jgi:DNA-binding GntR family transcriptional regulator